MTKNDKKLIESLRERYGTGWFGARDSRTPKPTLERLAHAGHLRIAKQAYSGNVYFAVKPISA